MKRRFSAIACACMTSLLMACGGGSGDSTGDTDFESPDAPTDVTDRYEGSWLTNCLQDYAPGENPAYPDGKSQLTGLVLNKLTATTMSFSITTNEYETADCTGTRVAAYFSRGEAVFDGVKSIGDRTVDRVRFHATTGEIGNLYDILWTDGNVLYRGQSGSVTADGYPSLLHATRPWSRI
ncbi:MAG: hypothetical protein R3E94_11250 [Burkholderiaceae bacterium]